MAAIPDGLVTTTSHNGRFRHWQPLGRRTNGASWSKPTSVALRLDWWVSGHKLRHLLLPKPIGVADAAFVDAAAGGAGG
jgi:hypothetical protein